MRWIIAALCAAVIFGLLDAMWLRWAADNLYRPIIGEIMADEFDMVAAGAFYVIYLLGTIWFAVRPGV